VLLAVPARADMSYVAGVTVPNNAPLRATEARITAGQSWTTNFFSGMASHGFNSMQGLLYQGKVTSANYPTSILPTSAGINLPSGVNNKVVGIPPSAAWPIAGFSLDTGDALTIGRSSILALQWLRIANGKAVPPTIEFNNGCPSSSWVSGPCGGLASPSATFTGSISGATLTVSGTVGAIVTGQWVVGAGVTDAQIAAFGTSGTTGTGGDGTYSVSGSQTVGPLPMTSESAAWRALNAIAPAVAAALPDALQKLASPTVYKSVLWVQGGSFDLTSITPTITEWTAMEAAYDALNLPGAGTTGMLYYLPIRAPNSDATTGSNAILGGVKFVRDNANGRTVGACPWYQWAFSGADNIHLGDYGTIREGECVALAEYVTEQEGTLFKPLWRALSGNITRSGQTLTVPFDRPVGSFFASASMAWMSDANDGIKVWPQMGFHVKRSGVDLTVTPTIVGMTVQLAIAETITPGDVLEVSYAYYGPGGPNPGPCSGVGGNLMMPGPASTLFPGKTINSWAWPFLESITA